MQINYNLDGSLKEIIGSNIFRASNNANFVDMTIDVPVNTIVKISLVQNDNTLLPAKPCTYTQISTGGYVWRYYLTEYDLRLNGALKISYLVQKQPLATTLTTEIISGVIQDSNATATTPVNPSLTDNILASISTLQADKQDKVDVNIKVNGGNNSVVGSLNILDTNKQDKTDTLLTTTSKTVVGAINELKTNKLESTSQNLETTSKDIVLAINEVNTSTKTNTANITTNTREIAVNAGKISYLEDHYATSETPIGTLIVSKLPTDAELAAFVMQKKGRTPLNNDSIIVVLEKVGTDEAYKYIYGGGTWGSYLIPGVEKASNGTYGIVQGSYIVGALDDLQVDIIGGKITAIYIRDTVSGNLIDINTVINQTKQTATANTTSIQNLVNGTIPAGNSAKLNGKVESELSVQNSTKLNNKFESSLSVQNATQLGGKLENSLSVLSAQSATKDSDNNIITSTYAKLADIYTKLQSDSRFISKSFEKLWYIKTGDISEDIPTTPPSGIQYQKAFTAAGAFIELFTIDHELAGALSLTMGNACELIPKIALNTNANVTFRLKYYYKHTAQTTFTQIAQFTSDKLSITGSASYPITTVYNLKTNFNLISPTDTIDLQVKDILRIVLEVQFDTITEKIMRLYSNIDYPSTFNLALSSVFVITSNTGAVDVKLNSASWTAEADGSFKATIPQTTHKISPSANLFIMGRELIGNEFVDTRVTNTVDANGNITLYSDRVLDLYVTIAGGIQHGNIPLGYDTVVTQAKKSVASISQVGDIITLKDHDNNPVGQFDLVPTLVENDIQLLKEKMVTVTDETKTNNTTLANHIAGQYTTSKGDIAIPKTLQGITIDSTVIDTKIAKNASDIIDTNASIASHGSSAAPHFGVLESISNKNKSNGYAGLDSNLKIAVANMPSLAVENIKGLANIFNGTTEIQNLKIAGHTYLLNDFMALAKMSNANTVYTMFGTINGSGENFSPFANLSLAFSSLTSLKNSIMVKDSANYTVPSTANTTLVDNFNAERATLTGNLTVSKDNSVYRIGTLKGNLTVNGANSVILIDKMEGNLTLTKNCTVIISKFSGTVVVTGTLKPYFRLCNAATTMTEQQIKDLKPLVENGSVFGKYIYSMVAI